jgi:hypothetical protein
MSKRTHGQRLVLIENARLFGVGFRSYLGFVASVAVVVLVAFVLPWLRVRWFVGGFGLGIAVMVIAVTIARPTDPAVRGQWAEEWSIESLRKVKGWLVTTNLPFERYDVDHVVVTPSAVLAVETKYRGRVSNPEFDARRHRRELVAAEEAARKIRFFLRSKKLHQSCSVEAVLMAWGPGRPTLPQGYRRDGDVYVVDADHPDLWSHLFAAPVLSGALRDSVHRAVQEYATARAGNETQRLQPLRTEVWSAFRQGVLESATERASRRELRSTLRRRHAAQG